MELENRFNIAMKYSISFTKLTQHTHTHRVSYGFTSSTEVTVYFRVAVSRVWILNLIAKTVVTSVGSSKLA